MQISIHIVFKDFTSLRHYRIERCRRAGGAYIYPWRSADEITPLKTQHHEDSYDLDVG